MKKRFVHYILIITAVIVSLVCVTPTHCRADAYDNTVRTTDEFFTALSRQIISGKQQCSYHITSDEVRKIATNADSISQNFKRHYNPEEPMLSGCYTYYCIDSWRVSWFENTKQNLNVEFQYNVVKERRQEYLTEIEKLAKSLKKDSDFESVKAVHDYIIKRVEYDHSKKKTNYTDVEGFRDNVMVCQGYAMASYAIFAYMKIPCRIIVGYAGDDNHKELHAWNIVQVDGVWYNYDATWDDAKGDKVVYTYFLKGKNDFPYHYPDTEYAPEELLNIISEESYRMPLSFSNIAPLHLESLIVSLIVFFVITVTFYRRIFTKNEPVGTVINDDFDDIIY